MTTLNRAISIVIVITVAAPLVLAVAPAARADWVDNNCDESGGNWDISTLKKSEAKSYAQLGVAEGYHWGGGCWNDNNVDDTPGGTEKEEYPRYEGPDCSGFTFKTWALRNNYGANGKRHWTRKRYVHGPYRALDFKNAPGTPISNVWKSNSLEMDAFASSTHIGMIWTRETSAGHDRIIEAKCDDCGTGKWIRDYRSNTSYEGARRTGWTPECYPNCI